MRTVDEGKREGRRRDEVEDEESAEWRDKRIFSEAGMFIDAIFARPHRRVVYTRWRNLFNLLSVNLI